MDLKVHGNCHCDVSQNPESEILDLFKAAWQKKAWDVCFQYI